MCIKANISLRITIYIYCQLIRNLKGHTQKRIILGLKQKNNYLIIIIFMIINYELIYHKY